jgi:hypothetical protein
MTVMPPLSSEFESETWLKRFLRNRSQPFPLCKLQKPFLHLRQRADFPGLSPQQESDLINFMS